MMKILSVNMYPFASKCPIGYMGEHIFNNESLFELFELYANDVEIYKTISESVCCNFNSKTVREVPKNRSAVSSVPQKKQSGIKAVIKNLARMLMPIRLSNDLMERIRAFAPDVIYTQGYNLRILKLSRKLARKLGVHLVVHTLDDWFTTKNKFDDLLKRIALNHALKYAISLSGSPAMTERIRALFHKESMFVSNCAKFEKANVGTENVKEALLYIGNLTPNRYVTVNLLAEELKRMGKDYRIQVYTPKEQLEAYQDQMTDNVVLHESVAQSEVPALLQRAKIMLHFEDFGKEHIDFIRYSLSTKVAEYASVGKPIVYLGPTEVGVAKFICESGVGNVYTDPQQAAERILELLKDSERYLMAADAAFENGKAYFDTDVVQQKVYERFREEV